MINFKTQVDLMLYMNMGYDKARLKHSLYALKASLYYESNFIMIKRNLEKETPEKENFIATDQFGNALSRIATNFF